MRFLVSLIGVLSFLAVPAQAAAPLCYQEVHAIYGLAGTTNTFFPILDLNGDGRTDLLFPLTDPNGERRPLGLDGHAGYTTFYDPNPGFSAVKHDLPMPTDPDGDGRFDCMDIDGDGLLDRLEIENSGEQYLGTAQSRLRLVRASSGAVIWDSGVLPGEVASVNTEDVMGGPEAEIIYMFRPNGTTSTAEARILDGNTKALLWSRAMNGLNSSWLDAAFDFDSNGKNDIRLMDGDYSFYGRNDLGYSPSTGSMLWQSNPTYSNMQYDIEPIYDDAGDADARWQAVDLDNDGQRDLTVSYLLYPNALTRTVTLEIRDAVTFALKGSFPASPPRLYGYTRSTQLDGDPAYEIVQELRDNTGFGELSRVLVYDAATKALEFSYYASTSTTSLSATNFPMDLNQDGNLDLVVYESESAPTPRGNIRVYDPFNGYSLLWQSNPGMLSPTAGSGLFGRFADDGDGLMKPVDLGNDGVPKVVEMSWDGSGARIRRTSTFEVLGSFPGIFCGVADVDPAPGYEVIMAVINGTGPGATTDIHIYGCPGPAFTATLTRTRTPALSPTPTPSLSPSFTATATPSPSPSPSLTATMTATLAGSPTETPSITPSFSVSPTLTVSLTVSETPTQSQTWTFTETPSATPTRTWTPTLSPSPSITSTPSITPTHSLSPTLAAVGAEPEILKAVCVPQPGGRELRVQLSQGAQTVKLKLYSSAYTLVGSLEEGPRPAGWSSIDLSGLRASLAPGIYFALVSAQGSGGRWSEAVHAKAYFLR